MISSLESLSPLSEIFIDANIFLYQILERPKFFPPCNNFLKRIELGVYRGITSTLVLNEVIHKLCLAETTKIYQLRSERDAARLLKERPETLSNLSNVWRSYADIKEYSLTIYGIDEATMDKAVDLSHRYGLLISDAAHTAVMMARGITNIATNDGDFERVEGIDVYKP